MKVALLGCGLIGGSIGLGLKQADPSTSVVAFDRDPSSAARAVERGAADGTATTAADAVAEADLIFLATPVGAIASVAADAARGLREGAIVTDVGSTKSRVVVEVEQVIPKGVRFIGGHPMAGTEDEGIEAASPDLFRGAWWILTPTTDSDADAYRTVHRAVATLGARVMALDPPEHDRLLAVVSHVPHLTATALMNLAAEHGKEHGGLLALAAGGFRDVTRVAASNPEIWLDICRENRDAIARALSDFAEQLLELRDLLERNDAEALRARFLSARTARRGLQGKDVSGDLIEVRFPVPDRPGVLAEVTTTVGNIGVNIEDLQITHSTEGGRGTIHLSVVGEEAAGRVVEALLARGFEPRTTDL